MYVCYHHVSVQEETLIQAVITPFKRTAFLLWRKEYPLLLFSSEDTTCKNIFHLEWDGCTVNILRLVTNKPCSIYIKKISSAPFCLSIPQKDLDTKKTPRNIDVSTQSWQNHVRILIYWMMTDYIVFLAFVHSKNTIVRIAFCNENGWQNDLFFLIWLPFFAIILNYNRKHEF